VALPSLFDQIDQQKRAERSSSSPTEPIGWGGVVEAEPLTTSEDFESTTLAETPAISPTVSEPESKVVADTDSTDSIPEVSVPMEKSVAVEKVEPKPSAVSKSVNVGKPSEPETRKTKPEKLESKPVAPKGTDGRALKKSSPVQDVTEPASEAKMEKPVEKEPPKSSNAVVEKLATPKPASRAKRTLTPLERKFAASMPKMPVKKKKVDKPELGIETDEDTDIETDEDTISPKLRILSSKYMARLEKAAESNPKVLRDELEKMRKVVDADDDDLPLADGQSDTKEEDNPFKKALGQFWKGEKRE
jgi:hypothetical protein